MPSSVSLSQLTNYCDKFLRHQEITDFEGAQNGLQLENDGRVTRIVAAVDANQPVVTRALEEKADFLVVHHGIGWSPLTPLIGGRHRFLTQALRGNLAIYGSHLPLDLHPRLGNNALLAKAIGLTQTTPFFEEKGSLIGRRGVWNGTRQNLAKKLGAVLGAAPLLLPGGAERIRRVGIVTGGAGNALERAADSGIDTFITGEGAHWTFSKAFELGLNVFYGGHYLTETFGVKALAAHLARKFHLPWSFVDVPSGL